MHDAGPVGAAPAVLIAQDKAHARLSLHAWVAQQYPHCRVLDATDAAEACRLALAERPAVVLVDIDMHDARGFEVLRALRTALPQAHLLALSLFHADAYRDYAAGAGAEACLSLTLSGPKLKDTLATFLAPSRGPHPRRAGTRAGSGT